MKTENQKQQLSDLGHDGRMALINNIEVYALYFTDYTIDNHGNKIYKTDVVEGGFLTEGQLLTAELVNL